MGQTAGLSLERTTRAVLSLSVIAGCILCTILRLLQRRHRFSASPRVSCACIERLANHLYLPGIRVPAQAYNTSRRRR